MKEAITIALAKGRLEEYALELLKKCGIDSVGGDSRSLVSFDTTGAYRFLSVKPADVPTYVERGIADLGMVGRDTIMEEGKDVYELIDLKFGKCRLCVAAKEDREQSWDKPSLRVGTKYPMIAKDYFFRKGITADIIKLHGSVELAPITNLSDVILDIVESGKTLKANGLVVVETIAQISARLIANKVSLKTKHSRLKPLLDKISTLIGENGNDNQN